MNDFGYYFLTLAQLIIYQCLFSYNLVINQILMLKIEDDIPLRETVNKLASFKRFSLIQKIAPKFYRTSKEASKQVAKEIRNLIEARNQQGSACVLGLATGSTPIQVYKQLIRMHKQQGLSFKNVITFNLDQYFPISHKDLQSYHYFMDQHLFNHIDIPRQNINVPSGQIDKKDVTTFCEQYQKKIQKCGGIDLQILGIGRTGHIGFNEPPSPQKSITRLVYLHRLTRKDASSAFRGIQNVPKCAITMGIDTINKAKKIIIMAWSENKANIVQRSIQGQKTNQNPSTFLHEHPNATFYLDLAAGQKLARFTIPWTIKGDYEDPQIPRTKYWIIKSVVWLSQLLKKPLLRLTYQDYEDNGLAPLVIDCCNGKVQNLNLFVFKTINAKITGWPLGDRPELSQSGNNFLKKKSANPQKILILSPHPDDDVISMGGLIKRLSDQQHNISIAYMTPGANSVHDHQAQKYLFFMREFINEQFWQNGKQELQIQPFNQFNKQLKEAVQFIKSKTENDRLDNQTILKIKSFIRESESKIAVQSLGIHPRNVYSLNLPFYGFNKIKKPVTEKDKQIVRDIITKIRPSFIYAAGDLTDPHGTHRKCLQILLQIVDDQERKAKQQSNYRTITPPANQIFFFRGDIEQWDISMARHIVVMSPKEEQAKIEAILKHQSQKDDPLFPGDNRMEFWQRAQRKNRFTADQLSILGFSDYQAVECFIDLNDLRNYE